MDFQALAVTRYSVRKFKDAPVEKEKIDLILNAARVAPTASNRQPQRIAVIDQPNGLVKIDQCTSFRFNAPVVLLVCYDADSCWIRPYDGEKSGPIDASIVTTHMMLQAHDIGLGTTWVMHFDPVKTVQAFELPEQLVPTAMLILGYPAIDAKPSSTHSRRQDVAQLLLSAN